MNNPRIRRILVPTDLNKLSVRPFVHGLRLATLTDAQLTVIHVDGRRHVPDWSRIPSPGELLWHWRVLAPNATEDDYYALAQSVRFQTLYGDGATLVEGIRSKHPDLVVLGTQARTGLQRLIEGSLAQQLFDAVGVVHLFFGPESRGFVSGYDGFVELRRILIPLDPEAPQLGVDAAGWFLRQCVDDVLEINYLWVGRPNDCPSFEPLLRPGWVGDVTIQDGPVDQVIVRRAQDWNADLIIMNSRGRDSLADLLQGSRTERVLHSAPCPVLAVPVDTETE